MAYSIEQGVALKELQLTDEIIVSTDCEEIAEVAREYGAKVPFLRPQKISGDEAKSIDFILHALDYYSDLGHEFDAVLLLQPTSPLRSVELLSEAIERFASGQHESLISVFKEEYVNDLVMYRRDGQTLKPLNENHNKGGRRQEHGAIYVRNGAIYLTRVDFLRNNSRIISDTPLMVEMKKSDSVNVDTEEDLQILRAVQCK